MIIRKYTIRFWIIKIRFECQKWIESTHHVAWIAWSVNCHSTYVLGNCPIELLSWTRMQQRLRHCRVTTVKNNRSYFKPIVNSSVSLRGKRKKKKTFEFINKWMMWKRINRWIRKRSLFAILFWKIGKIILQDSTYWKNMYDDRIFVKSVRFKNFLLGDLAVVQSSKLFVVGTTSLLNTSELLNSLYSY